jgi:hypothetical protein
LIAPSRATSATGQRPLTVWVPSRAILLGPPAVSRHRPVQTPRVHGPRPLTVWVPSGEIVLGPPAVSRHRPDQTRRVDRTTSPHCVGPPWGNRVGPAGRITPSPSPDVTSARTTSLSLGPLWGKSCWHRGPYHTIGRSRRHECTDHVPLRGSPLGKIVLAPRPVSRHRPVQTPSMHGPRPSLWVPPGEMALAPRPVSHHRPIHATSARTTSLSMGPPWGKSYWPAGPTRPNASLPPVIT